MCGTVLSYVTQSKAMSILGKELYLSSCHPLLGLQVVLRILEDRLSGYLHSIIQSKTDTT